ncbi:hypothetical protein WJX77_004127 [Trebouxia sp. C0004]
MPADIQACLRGSAGYAHKLEAASHIFDIWTDRGADVGALADRYLDGSVDMLDQFMADSAVPHSCDANYAAPSAPMAVPGLQPLSQSASSADAQLQAATQRTKSTAAQKAEQGKALAPLADVHARLFAASTAQTHTSCANDHSNLPDKAFQRSTACQEPQQGIPVWHKDDLSYEQFVQRFMQPNLPVVIQGLTCDWQASKDWVTAANGVNIDFIAHHFGQAQVLVSNTTRLNGGCAPRLDMTDWHFANEYPDCNAYQTPCYFQEDWLNEFYDIRQRRPQQRHRAGSADDTLQAGPVADKGDVEERAANGDRSGGSNAGCDIASSDYRFVYLGCKGTWTPLHADVLRSYSWSTNVTGRKRWKLLPPQFTHLLYDRFGREMAATFDIGKSDGRDRFPNLDTACQHTIECVQEAGETIFVPSGWHHTVENIEDTLSINHNWLNGYNIHWALALLQQERTDAIACIEDCREGCTEVEFENLVQRNMAANCGMNYAFMATFMHLILQRESQLLRDANQESKARHSFNIAKSSWTLRELRHHSSAVHSIHPTLGCSRDQTIGARNVDLCCSTIRRIPELSRLTGTRETVLQCAMTPEAITPEVSNARHALQKAIDACHFAPTAKYLREAAAACLLHGLQSVQADRGQPHWQRNHHALQLRQMSGLHLVPSDLTMGVAVLQQHTLGQMMMVLAKQGASCSQQSSGVMGRIQLGVKYFRLMGTSHVPSAVLLRLYDIIINPSQATGMSSLLQSIRVVDNQEALAAAAQQTQSSAAFLQLSLPDNLDPTPKAVGGSSAKQAFATSNAAEAISRLKAAVAKSHPPTAQYIVETAAACLDHGLQSSDTGLLLRPVAWSLVADAVYRSCPQIADLLEKLCGRTGQKYFQLLGNSESGEPEFVGANLDALVMPKQVPAVRGILDQLYGRSQAVPKQPAARPADVASTHLDDATAGDAIQKVPDRQDEALSEPAVTDPGAEGQANDQLPSAGSQTLTGDNLEATQAVQRPTVVYAPPEPSASAGTGSTPAMQALLSACMQVPTNSASNIHGVSKQPVWVPAVPPVPAARPASASAVASAPEPAATSAARPASATLSAAVPVKTHSSDTVDKAAAVAANGAASAAITSGTSGSSASSSASGVSLVLKARSSASTELSDSSVPAADKHPASPCQPAGVNPFCLECKAQPGQCVRHPLVTDTFKPIETKAPRDAHIASDCSSQDHKSLHAEPDQRVAVMVDLDELNGRDALSKLKLGQIQVYSSQGSMMFDIKDQTWSQHMQHLKSLLEDSNVVKVLYDAGAAAAVLFQWEGLAIRNVFDVQAAQGVLDHMQNLLDSTSYKVSRSFEDIVSMHGQDPRLSEGLAGLQASSSSKAAMMLHVAARLCRLLGDAGTNTVHKLSQALVQQSHTGNRAFGQPRANVDFRLSFSQDGAYTLTLSKLTEITAAVPEMPDPDVDMQTFLDLLPSYVRDAIIEHSKAKQNAMTKEAAPDAVQSISGTDKEQHVPGSSPTSALLNQQGSVEQANGTATADPGSDSDVLDAEPGSPASQLETEATISMSDQDGQHQDRSAMTNGHVESDVQCDRCGMWSHAASKCTEEYCDCCQLKGHNIRSCMKRHQQEAGNGLELHQAQDSVLPAPSAVSSTHQKLASCPMLSAVIADKGRPVVIRFGNGSTVKLPVNVDIAEFLQKLVAVSSGRSTAHLFDRDNRLRLDDSLHQVSAIRDSDEEQSIVGLTLRLGRHTPGVGDLLMDVLSELQRNDGDMAGTHGAHSVLVLGLPGTGKTTLLRDMATILSDKLNKYVMVIDSNNEIGGNGSVSHQSLGGARRVPVHDRARQHEIMLQAAHNHKPEVMLVDAVSSAEDVKAIRSIIQRGISVVCAAEATSLTCLMDTPELRKLVDMSQREALYAASRNHMCTSTRQAVPNLSLIEVLGHGHCRLHWDVSGSIDTILAGEQTQTQLRMHKHGKLLVRFERSSSRNEASPNLGSHQSYDHAAMFD